jgi:hypothetical protein
MDKASRQTAARLNRGKGTGFMRRRLGGNGKDGKS